MKPINTLLAALTLVAIASAEAKDEPKPMPINVPAGIDHGVYDRLLKKYVNTHGLVAYEKWKHN